jgi:hypothetical protein
MRTQLATRRTFAQSIVIAVLVALCTMLGTTAHRLAYAEETQEQASANSGSALFPMGYPADDAEPSERHTVRKSEEELLTKL